MGLQESLFQLRHRLPPRRLLRLIPTGTAPDRLDAGTGRGFDAAIDRAPPYDLRRPLPPPLRPHAVPSVLDITKYFGETSGGIRTYLLEKARYVTAHPALRQTIVVPGPHDALIEADGVRVYRLRGPRIPAHPPYRFMLATRSIGRIIVHERPDLIEVGSPFLVPWLARRAARPLGIPLVWFYHANFPRVLAPDPVRSGLPRRAAAALAWGYVRIVGRLFRTVIVASEYARQDLEAQGVGPVARVSLGVDVEHFHPRRRADRASICRRFGLPDGPLALYVGRLAVEKDVDTLVAAWADVERRTGAHLVLMGDGPAAARLRSAAKATRITWIPFQPDRERVANLLAAADLYVAPGALETFGLAPLEALASGTPVLCADRGAVRELIDASGAGALFTARSAGALAEAAIALFASDLPELGARGRAYAEAHHRWETVFDRLFDVYRSVLAS